MENFYLRVALERALSASDIVSFFSIICKLLFGEQTARRKLSLHLWHNNSGVEFDMLQTVFRAEIPTVNQEANLPSVTDDFSHSALVHFCVVALCTDSWVEIHNETTYLPRLSIVEGMLAIETDREITFNELKHFLLGESNLKEI
jgi:hypothetical protein